MQEDDLKQPSRREWASFWSLVALQIFQSFNVNVAKFVLVALAAWLLSIHQTFRGVEHVIVICLVIPYVLFAPTAGWLSDRFAKTFVIRWTSWMQLGALGFLAASLHFQTLWPAILSFFLIGLQAALLSPSKIGVVKEYVGARRLGFASGVMEGTVILAILGGQIIGGTWFDNGISSGQWGWDAALAPMWTLIGLCLLSIVLAHTLQKTQPQTDRKFSLEEAVSHMRDLGEFFRDRSLLLYGLTVAYFWGFGGFINLIVLQIAEQLFHGGAGTGGAFAGLWAMPGIGIILGSIAASFMSRRNVELGLAPFGAIMMAVSTAILAFAEPQSILMLVMLVIAGASAAMFLVPMQAMVQDKPSDEKRGAVISASNLLNSLAGILAVLLQLAFKLSGAPVSFQFIAITILSVVVAAICLKHFATDLVRLVGLALVRTFYRIRVTGLENLPRTGGVLLLPNHVTYADAFFLSAACPRRVRFVMDETFMKNPAVRGFCRLFQTVPIRSGSPRVALKETIEALQAGDVLCLFPEGQLTRTGTLCPLQRGFEFIARLAKCPLVPVWTDGAWGSVFSFERGRFFNKRPYEIPYRLSVAFGKPLDPATAGRDQLRTRLLETSADAIAARVEADASKTKPLTLIHHDNLSPDEVTRAWANGYQIGQTHTLPRRERFAWREGDPVASTLPGLSAAFPALYHSPLIAAGWFRPEMADYWIGGAALRGSIAAAPEAPVVFFDFSPRSAAPFKRPGLIHCPCLAIEGIVVAMSMPDPPVARSTNLPQAGSKPGTWGKLLPGFYFRIDPNDIPRVHGPSTPKGGLALPVGTTLDDDGFLVPPRLFS
jgi:acyl-[acyl-carrier-protein]-phospholipid O-acyltransferase/long-chain-fatty-acid--[acyl-carrier-protein] ligase